jgi:hypothetical protein
MRTEAPGFGAARIRSSLVGQFGMDDWEDLPPGNGWPLLLAGNGASRAVSAAFAYGSLFDAAVGAELLNANDVALFQQAGTKNFEEVLRALDFAALVLGQLGHCQTAVLQRRQSIQNALVATVKTHHVSWNAVDGQRLTAIKAALLQSEAVFSTSYDLLFYWAINFLNADDFVDYFWSMPGNYFDPTDTPIWGDRTAVYWIHGALQLYEDGAGNTAKRVNLAGEALLSQFASDDKLPLYVAEGTHHQKKAKIASSQYLAFCLDAFESDGRDLVVFGQALGESDRHLVDAIKLHPNRRIACSIFPSDQASVALERARVSQLLEPANLFFFDSTTHPLGDSSLFVG